MAVSGKVEFDVDVAPSVIMEMLRDVQTLPDWSDIHKRAEVLEYFDDGLPKLVDVDVSISGIADHEVVEYSWTDHSCAWKVLESKQLKSQQGKYTVHKTDSGTHVVFELEVDLNIKLPGLIIKRGQKSVLDTAKKAIIAEATRRSA